MITKGVPFYPDTVYIYNVNTEQMFLRSMQYNIVLELCQVANRPTPVYMYKHDISK